MDEPRIGDHVVYVDSRGRTRDALVTAIHEGMKPEPGAQPGVNVVLVSDDEAREDSYGRQVERETSVVHEASQPAHGNYWREP